MRVSLAVSMSAIATTSLSQHGIKRNILRLLGTAAVA